MKHKKKNNHAKNKSKARAQAAQQPAPVKGPELKSTAVQAVFNTVSRAALSTHDLLFVITNFYRLSS